MTNDNSGIKKYFQDVGIALEKVDCSAIVTALQQIKQANDMDRTIYIFGNGGSGATASHFCADLVKGVSQDLSKRLKAICLNDNIPTMTAIANDISFEEIFVEQLKNRIVEDDLVIAFSGSGNSPNVVKAIEYANNAGAKTIGFCGYDGGMLAKTAKLAIHVSVNDMEISEDAHLVVCHAVKRMLMRSFTS